MIKILHVGNKHKFEFNIVYSYDKIKVPKCFGFSLVARLLFPDNYVISAIIFYVFQYWQERVIWVHLLYCIYYYYNNNTTVPRFGRIHALRRSCNFPRALEGKMGKIRSSDSAAAEPVDRCW